MVAAKQIVRHARLNNWDVKSSRIQATVACIIQRVGPRGASTVRSGSADIEMGIATAAAATLLLLRLRTLLLLMPLLKLTARVLGTSIAASV